MCHHDVVVYIIQTFNASYIYIILKVTIPLAYHPSALKCNPAFLCNLEHQLQQDMPSVHLLTKEKK